MIPTRTILATYLLPTTRAILDGILGLELDLASNLAFRIGVHAPSVFDIGIPLQLTGIMGQLIAGDGG